MGLLVKRAGAEEYGQRLKMLIAGPPGAGKTRMSSTAPGVLYASAEGGLMSVADRAPAYVDIVKSDDLNQLRAALAGGPTLQEKLLGMTVETVVLDTLDEIQRILVRERLESQRKESLAIQDFGWLGDQMRAIVRNYRNLDINVIFTVHTKDAEDSETGAAYVKPALQGAMADELAAYVDIAGLIKTVPSTVVQNGEAKRILTRVLQTSPDARHSWLKDRSGKLTGEFELNLTDDFVRILRSIFGNAPQAPTTSTETAKTPPPAAPRISSAERALQTQKTSTPAAPVAETEPEPESQPEPAPEPAPEVTPEPVAEPEPTPQPAPAKAAAKTAKSSNGSSSKSLPMDCSVCGQRIETEDQRDLALLRYRTPLCRTDFVNYKPQKRSAASA